MVFRFTVKTGIQVAITCGVIFGLASGADAKPRKHIALQRSAAVTGLAASHDLRREGNHLCFSEHTHYGSSTGQPNQRAAQLEAIRSWSDFVYFEYGNEWDKYASASSKDMKCTKSGAAWGCDLSARPCR